jgi:hypothetical protein
MVLCPPERVPVPKNWNALGRLFLIFRLIETKSVGLETRTPDLIRGRDFAVFPEVIVPAQTKQSV